MVADHANDLILITCANGKQARSLLPHLYGKYKRIRLVVRSTSSEKKLKEQYPETEVVRANLGDLSDVKRVTKGVTTIFHVGPAMDPHETEFGYTMIDAAVAESKSGSFQHFVYSSVISTQLRKLLNHDCKRYVEEYLMESGLNYTILQPSHFFENTPPAMFLGQENPVYPTAYNPNIKFSFTAVRDMGEASAVVIEQKEKHYFALYPIVSTVPMPRTELIETIGKVIGKPIQVKQQSLEEGVKWLTKVIFAENEVDPRAMDISERLLLYYNRHGIVGNPNVTEWLLGRKATSAEEWVNIEVDKAKKAQC